jgi:hypothetical protein
MANVLTEGSIIQCSHQGPIVATASQSALTVDGQKVLVANDMSSAAVTCPLAASGGTPCTIINPATSGVATTLTVGGQPVLLDSAQGTTNAGTWSVTSAGQTKLQAT